MLIGGEDIHLRLAFMQSMREQGFRIIAVGSAPQPDIEAAGFEYHWFPLERKLSPFADICTLLALRQIVSLVQPDIVHAFDTKPIFLTPLALRSIKGPKMIRTVNGMGALFSEGGARNRILRVVYRLLHRAARSRVDYTIFQNATDMAFFEHHRLVATGAYELIPGSGVALPNFRGRESEVRTEVRRELGIAPDDFVFIIVARMVRQKGVADMLAAGKKVLTTHSNARFILLGPSGTEEPDGIPKKDLVANGSSILYLGRRSDVNRLLLASDVFVLPSRYREGVPRALLEALAVGLPVIVSDMPGCADPVLASEAGWVIRAGDIENLSWAMVDALTSSPERLKSMGVRGRMEIEKNYSIKNIMEATVRLYLRIA